MSVAMLIGLLGSVLVGVVLLVLGIRGKRINDHPSCRDCRFDLVGVYPGVVTCPECGAGLKRDRAIVTGQRRKMWVVALVGCGMIGLPSLGIGTVGFALLTGTNLSSYKPVGFLLWDSRHAGEENCAAAGKELLNRLNMKKLSKDQIQTVIQAALVLQGDLDRPWDEAWGDILETVNMQGNLSKEQLLTYHKQAAVFEFEIRPNVLLGDAVPVIANLVEARVGSNSQLISMVLLNDGTIDGVKRGRATGEGQAGPLFRSMNDQMYMSWIYMYGSGLARGTSIGGCVKLLVELPEEIGIGPHDLTATLRLRTMEQPQGTFNWPNTIDEEHEETLLTEVGLAFNVVDDAAGRIDVVEATSQLDDEMVEVFSLTQAAIWNGASGGQQDMNISISFQQPPVPGAFEVFLRSGTTEWKLGAFTTGKSANPNEGDRWGWGWKERSRHFNAQVNGFKGTTADVILRPNAKLATETMDLVQIYGGELVLEDIEIRREEYPGTTGISTGIGLWLRRLFTGE